MPRLSDPERRNALYQRLVPMGPGCVKTCAAENALNCFLFVPVSTVDCQCCCCLFKRNRDKISTCKFDIGVLPVLGQERFGSSPLKHDDLIARKTEYTASRMK